MGAEWHAVESVRRPAFSVVDASATGPPLHRGAPPDAVFSTTGSSPAVLFGRLRAEGAPQLASPSHGLSLFAFAWRPGPPTQSEVERRRAVARGPAPWCPQRPTPWSRRTLGRAWLPFSRGPSFPRASSLLQASFTLYFPLPRPSRLGGSFSSLSASSWDSPRHCLCPCPCTSPALELRGAESSSRWTRRPVCCGDRQDPCPAAPAACVGKRLPL